MLHSTNPTYSTDQAQEVDYMTNEQSEQLQIMAMYMALDELAEQTTDPAVLKTIAERKKVLRALYHNTLNTKA